MRTLNLFTPTEQKCVELIGEFKIAIQIVSNENSDYAMIGIIWNHEATTLAWIFAQMAGLRLRAKDLSQHVYRSKRAKAAFVCWLLVLSASRRQCLVRQVWNSPADALDD